MIAAHVPAIVPIRLTNNHVVVRARVNGAGPFTFVVDSGASNLIDPAVAARAQAVVHGRVRLVGVGRTAVLGAYADGLRIAAGAATFADQRFVVAPTRAALSAAEGVRVDGLLGRGVIGDGITVIDYAHARIIFHARPAVLRANGMETLALGDRFGLPQTACRIARVSGQCTIDTGSRLAVTIPAPFARRHPHVVPPVASGIGIDGYGIGGPVYGRIGTLASLTLGAVVLRDVPADFSVAQHGVFADPVTAANIGGAVLRRFTVAFDLAHGRIGLQPNAAVAQPYLADRSGAFVTAHGDHIAVLGVRRHSPAARAGLRDGDVLLSVGGRPAYATRLAWVRRIFAQPAADDVRLIVRRAGRTLRIVLPLSERA